MRSLGIWVLVVLSALLGKASAVKLSKNDKSKLGKLVEQAIKNPSDFLEGNLNGEKPRKIVKMWFNSANADGNGYIDGQELAKDWNKTPGNHYNVVQTTYAIKNIELAIRKNPDCRLRIEDVVNFINNGNGKDQMYRVGYLLTGKTEYLQPEYSKGIN